MHRHSSCTCLDQFFSRCTTYNGKAAATAAASATTPPQSPSSPPTPTQQAPDSRGRSEKLGRGECRGANQRVRSLRLGEFPYFIFPGLIVQTQCKLLDRNTQALEKHSAAWKHGTASLFCDLERPIAGPAFGRKPNAIPPSSITARVSHTPTPRNL